jgi:hypothetical protein
MVPKTSDDFPSPRRCKHRQPPLGDLDADVLEVVLARALDADQVVAIGRVYSR